MAVFLNIRWILFVFINNVPATRHLVAWVSTNIVVHQAFCGSRSDVKTITNSINIPSSNSNDNVLLEALTIWQELCFTNTPLMITIPMMPKMFHTRRRTPGVEKTLKYSCLIGSQDEWLSLGHRSSAHFKQLNRSELFVYMLPVHLLHVQQHSG